MAQLPEWWSGYLLSTEKIDLGPEVLRQVAAPESLPGWGGPFHLYRFLSSKPLAGEIGAAQGQTFPYRVLVTPGEQFTLLVSENKKIAEAVVFQIRRQFPQAIVKRALIEVHWIVLFLMGEHGQSQGEAFKMRLGARSAAILGSILALQEEVDISFRSEYTLSTVFAEILRQEQFMQKVSLYGTNVWQHDLFRAYLEDMKIFYCGLRKSGESAEIFAAGNDGFLTFSAKTRPRLRLIVDVLGYLVKRGFIHKR
ncbi:MAG: hypothetical protein JO340_02010 [Acidobacteriaceae bacterium]|nr:hypothetical protein [Acidobacteriaceae bacterium]